MSQVALLVFCRWVKSNSGKYKSVTTVLSLMLFDGAPTPQLPHCDRVPQPGTENMRSWIYRLSGHVPTLVYVGDVWYTVCEREWAGWTVFSSTGMSLLCSLCSLMLVVYTQTYVFSL